MDEWKLGDVINIEQHKTLEDRIRAADKFRNENDFKLPLVVDTMKNEFDLVYAAWPERGFVVHEGKMQYICDIDNDGSMDWLSGIEKWLLQNCRN